MGSGSSKKKQEPPVTKVSNATNANFKTETETNVRSSNNKVNTTDNVTESQGHSTPVPPSPSKSNENVAESKGQSTPVTPSPTKSIQQDKNQEPNIDEKLDHVNSEPCQVPDVQAEENTVYQIVETTQLLGYEPAYSDFPISTTLKKENVEFVNFVNKKKAKVDNNIPSPNALAKEDVFIISGFTKIDNIALGAPKDLLQQSLDDTVKYLVKNCSKEIEKVRVIFRWAAAQNLQKLPALDGDLNGATKPTLWYLHKLKDSYTSHAEWFQVLCQIAGLTCMTVQGTVKAKHYEVGDPIDFEGSKNDWSLVRISNTWKLLDLNFASRRSAGGGLGEWELMDDNAKQGVQKEGGDPEGILQALNENYFLTNPEEFIFTHFPTDRSHQLLARSVTEREFQEMAYLWGPFFTLGLEATSSSMKGAIEAIDGEVDIEIRLPQKGQRRFMYQLYRSTKDGTSIKDFQGYKFNQFVFMQQGDQTMKCKVIFPIAGKYKLELYARNSDCEDKDGDKVFEPVAKYLITCDPAKDNPVAFPENHRMEWGPGSDLTAHGITPVSHTHAVIETDTGNVQLQFKTEIDAAIVPVLRSNNKDMDKKLEQYLLHNENGQETTVDVKLPEGGTYALDIYGKGSEDGIHPLLCTYLINTTEGSEDTTPFPEVPNQKAGATTGNKTLGLKPISPKESVFTAESGEVEIELETTIPTEFTTSLHLQNETGQEEIDNHIFMEQKDGKVKFKTRFPKPGTYLLGVYGKEQDSSDTGLPNVYNYVINVPNALDGCKPYPEVFNLWTDGCQISGIQDGVLPCGEDVDIKVTVPGAKDVAVIGKNWTKLTQNTAGEWEGKVNPDEDDTAIQVSADYDDSGNYATLLRYQTISKKQIEAERKEKEKKQKALLDKKKAEEEKKRKAAAELEALEKELEAAINSKDLKSLTSVVRRIEKKNCTQKFLQKYNTAKEMIKSLERRRRLHVLILEMNQGTMAEIRSYSNPPDIVKDVMVAVLLLLGDHEGITKDWKKCQALCNSVELKKQVRQFHVEQLHPEIAARAKQMLSKYRLDDVNVASAGAACFYAWTNGMIEELNISNNGVVVSATPASVKRQKELLKLK